MLVPGFVGPLHDGGYPTGGTVTLVKGNPIVIVDTGDVSQRQQILDGLATHRVAAADVAWVVNTHGHLDHIGNNNLFPAATFVLDGDIARSGEYRTHDFARGPLLIAGGPGANALTILRTPGHTNHDLSVIVATPIGTVAVVGDLFEHAGDDADGSWQRWSQDERLQLESRARVRAMAEYIVPGHGNIFRVER